MSGTEEIDVDAILANIEAPQGERPMTSPPEAQPTPAQVAPEGQPVAQQPQAPVQPREWELDYKGKKIKADEERMKIWAQQGYDYQQKMAKFNADQAELEKLRAELDPYRKVDAYAKSNPEWWERVNAAHQQVSTPNQQGQRDPTEALRGEINEIKSKLSAYEQKELEAVHAAEDQKLDQVISSLRKKYPEIDFSKPDATGRSLEYRVFEHANRHGINSFSGAFYDLYAEKIEQMYEARGREATQKELQQRTKAGVLGEYPSSRRTAPSSNGSVKGKSYDQLMREGLEELGIK